MIQTLTDLCWRVDVESCSRSVAGRVEGPDSDAAVPLLHHQERRRLRDVLNLSVWLDVQLVSDDATFRLIKVGSLRRQDIMTVIWKQ